MIVPTVDQVERACFEALPEYPALREEEQRRRRGEALMWLETWRSVFPRIIAGEYGIGKPGGEIPPVAALRACKINSPSYLDLPSSARAPIRAEAVRWLEAWRLAFEEPAPYIAVDSDGFLSLAEEACFAPWPSPSSNLIRPRPIRAGALATILSAGAGLLMWLTRGRRL